MGVAASQVDPFIELLGPTGPAAPPATVLVPAAAGGDMAMGAFEAADRYDQALSLWAPPIRSADADLLPEKEILDARSRDMVRNDAYVQGGANLHKDNIVGSQYLLNARPATKVLFGKQDDRWEEAFQEEVEEKFDLWAESPDNWVDAARRNTFTELVRMVVGISMFSGEFLASVEFIKDDGSPFSTAIQLIDLDRLSTAPLSYMEENVRSGIRMNSRGAPIAYQVRTQHPNDLTWKMGLPDWKEVAVRKPWGRLQMIHIYEQTRVDQSRGVAEMVTALKEMRMAHKLRDVNLQRHVTQALYAATITSDLPTEAVMASLGSTSNSEQVAEALGKYANGYLSEVGKYAGEAKGLRVDGVRIPHLYPGTKLDLTSPAKDSSIGTDFEQSILRYIASAIGVSYEQLSRDYTNTNYSSARAAMTETWKYMQSRKKFVADKFASIIYRLWLEEAINNDHLVSFPKAMAPTLYTKGVLNLKFQAISRADWVGASRGQIDELKETQAAVLRINNGLSTAEDELARLGKDFRKVYRQLAREQKMRDAYGLMFAANDPSVLALAAQPTNEGVSPRSDQ